MYIYFRFVQIIVEYLQSKVMFEKLVQRILNRILGEYVEGFNSKNLQIGLWSGEVVIQNVSLKQQIIQKLNLPLKLKYSRLGCLKLNIPWKDLASSKIDVVVSGLELLITEIPESQWSIKNVRIIEQRKEEIQKYTQAIMQDFLKKSQKLSTESNESGYFSKMVTKIIDNLQVVVKDIHIRYEDSITKKYAFGLTLQELKIYTVNSTGQPEFIDRTKKQYENEPLRKNLILSNLGLYWNEQTEFLAGDTLHEEMLQTIARKQSLGRNKLNYLILMSSNAQLLQREAGKQFEVPEINLLISFERLKIQISNQQLQQIVNLGERMQKYTNEVQFQNRKKLTQLEMITNRDHFLRLFPKYYDKTISKEELAQVESILEKMEVAIFHEGIKEHLQHMHKEKMVKSKKQKSRGWFSGPKELTEQENQEIQAFIDNLGSAPVNIDRPPSFYYLQVNFVLRHLEIVVANNKSAVAKDKSAPIKDGIRSLFEDIQMDFGLRTGGYQLNFGIHNVKVELFSRLADSSSEEKVINIIQKLSDELHLKKDSKYIGLKVIGHPLDKPRLDTQIILNTGQLLVNFHPEIVKIAQDFVDVQMSAQNSEVAFEAYGQIRNKTTTIAASSLEANQKKNFLSIDATVNSMTLILFFKPALPESNVWAIRLGSIRVFTDPQVLNKSEFADTEAMEKYCMQLSQISVAHHESKAAFVDRQVRGEQVSPKSRIFKDLDMEFSVQLFEKATDKIPKIRVRAVMHAVDLTLSEFNYQHMLKIGDCFALSESSEGNTREEKIQLKSEVTKNAKKIGILWEQTKQVKKYICILNGGYLYFYSDKKDTHYTDYKYIRNSTFEVVDIPRVGQKPFSVLIKNSVNSLSLGFEKEEVMNSWINSIRSLETDEYKIMQKKPEEQKQKAGFKKSGPNQLNFQVDIKIQEININTILRSQKTVEIMINSISTNAKLHDLKTVLAVSLKSIQLRDDIFDYKYRELANFVYSESIEGKNKLIDICILQLNPEHPEYQFVDTQVFVNFGKLTCNYKPQTVKNLMKFFLPASSQEKRPTVQADQTKQQKSKGQLLEQLKEKNKSVALTILADVFLKKQERFSIKVDLRIQELAAALVNSKNKVMFGKLGLIGFKFNFGQSARRMLLSGGLEELWFQDLSRYPYTIVEEADKYDQINYLLDSDRNQNDMMSFNIELLQILNDRGKKMLISTTINDLRVSYVQQPVLRLITYLTQQVLPSLSAGSETQSSQQPVFINDSKPEESPMDINIRLERVVTMIEPRSGLGEHLRVEVKKVHVTNKNAYKNWIQGADFQSTIQQVLVENYSVEIQGIKIEAKYGGEVTKLTNDLNVRVSCDLIANPAYYHKTFGTRFKAGMRLNCHLTPFLMRINHEDYNFMMKCLFWSISYDDNAEGYLFDGAAQTVDAKGQLVEQESDPMYLFLVIEKIALCVTQKQLPISVLLLNNMRYNLTMNQRGMVMDLSIKHLNGTNISPTCDPQISKQIGLFNNFGHQRELKTKELYEIPSLVKLVSRDDLVYEDRNRPVIEFYMQMGKNGDMEIDMTIDALRIFVELKNLLILSKLALMDSNIQPPAPRLKAINKPAPPEGKGGKMKISLQMNDFLGSLSDNKGENFIVMEGVIGMKLLMFPTKEQREILTLVNEDRKILEVASHQICIKNFSFYFCDMNRLNKRFIMLPLSILLSVKQFYSYEKEEVLNHTKLEGKIEKIIIEASIKDLLKISAIVQDNLKKMSQANAGKPSEPVKHRAQSQILTLTTETKVNIKVMEQTLQTVQKKIHSKTKADINLAPMLIKIVNDCDNNFMPVINFIVQETTLLLRSDPLITHFSQQNIIVKMDFFNPRSSDWEPVIQNFGLSLDYLSLVHEHGQEAKTIVSSSEVEELSELKINISTQFIASIMATLQIANLEQKKLIKAHSVESIEVSPYIILNLTYDDVFIHRTTKGKPEVISLPPLYKGPVRLTNQDVFSFEVARTTHKTSMQKLGITKIKKGFYVQFSAEKLNRVIRVVNGSLLQNNTESPLYCIRYDRKSKKIDESPLIIEPGSVIPVLIDGSFQLSFNGRTFTGVAVCKDLGPINEIQSENSKYKLSVVRRRNRLGHQTFSIWAPITVNNCLPKDLKIQFIRMGKTASTKDILRQSSHEVFANEQIFNLRFKIITDGFYWSPEFGLYSGKEGEEQTLYMSDREQQGGTCLKYIIQKKENRNMYHFNIYCSIYIVSELSYDISIYANLLKDEKTDAIEKYYKLGGQSNSSRQKSIQPTSDELGKVTIVGAEVGNKVRICGTSCMVDFSVPIVISGLGITQSRIVIEQETEGKIMDLFALVGAKISLKKMNPHTQIYAKQIVLRSRSIVINNTHHDLWIKEEGGEKYIYQIAQNTRKPFYFTMPEVKEKPRGLIVKADGFRESFPMMSNDLGTIYFKLERLDNKICYVFFRLNVEEIKDYIVYSINEIKYSDLPYQLVIKSELIEAKIPALMDTFLSKHSESLCFINERPNQPFALNMHLKAAGINVTQEVTVEVDNLSFRKELNFYGQNQNLQMIPVVVYVLFNDTKKFIVVEERFRAIELVPEYPMQTINLRLDKLSVSIIQNHSLVERPSEAFYFYMSNLQFFLKTTNKRTIYQARLQFLQLDQSSPFNIANPVILTPNRFKEYVNPDPKAKTKSFFNALVEIDNNFVKNTFISEITIDISDLVLHIDTQLIKLGLHLSKNLSEVMNPHEENQKVQNKINTWNELKVASEGHRTFIKSIKISPFTIEISAEVRFNQLDTETVIFFGTIINALGVVITNIEGAPLLFEGIAINDCVDTAQGLNKKLVDHYKSSLIRQMYMVFGSLNIIGNPVSLFRNISTGFRELKDKPSEGFVEGPLEFGMGLAEGTSCLITRSIGGALNSVEKVTGTIASGLAALAFDKQFEEMREKQKMKKPKHIFEGLEKGGKAIFNGFKEGITGLFTKPYENTKKQGAIGFFKGAAQGVTGLVVKPVSGVVDFASKTTEGLKNTVMYFEDKPNENRIRYPRVFYTELSEVRQYNPVDSKLYAVINKTKYEERYGFENTLFIQSFMITSRKFLLLLLEDLAMIRIDDEKIEWAVPVEGCSSRPEGKKLRVKAASKREWYTPIVDELIQFTSEADQVRFEKLLVEMKELMKQKEEDLKLAEEG